MIGQQIVTVGPYKITRLSDEQVSVERKGVPREEAEPARVQLLVLALVDEVVALRQALEDETRRVVSLRQALENETRRRKVVERLADQGFLPADRG